MLTTDLIRVRIAQGQIIPRYLKPKDTRARNRAEALIQCFTSHLGKTRGELEDAISNAIGDGTDYLIWRGLAKILYDRAEFAVETPIPCEEVRRVIFEEEAKRHPVIRPERVAELGAERGAARREDVLAAAAARLGLTPEAVERAMYADLDDAHQMKKLDPLTPEELIERYNVSLVQSILLRATEMRIMVRPEKPSRLRQLFRFIKFFRLMYRVAPVGEHFYSITLDGPVSLFRMSQKYGFQIACFFPALLLCEQFQMEADILWGKDNQRLLLKIDENDELTSHYQDTGHYVCEEGRWLEERWAQLKIPWSLEKEGPPINLGGHAVIVPDYTIRAPDGREVFCEIVGFWRKGYLESRLELIRAYGPKNLILIVSDRLRVSEDALANLPAAVFFYKGAIPPKDLFALAQSCAPPPPPRVKKPVDPSLPRPANLSAEPLVLGAEDQEKKAPKAPRKPTKTKDAAAPKEKPAKTPRKSEKTASTAPRKQSVKAPETKKARSEKKGSTSAL